MAIAARLSRARVPGKMAPPENWHITLRFLGRVDEIGYERFLQALDALDLGGPFRIGLGEMGAFPRARSATVIWLGVSKGVERLGDLATATEEAAQTAGLVSEERPFRAHLTLTRVRPPEDVSDLIAAHPEIGIEWRCRSLVVYQSHLGRGGARYEALETFTLSR